MSEVVSMINNMKAPGSQPRKEPRRKKKRAVIFQGVLQHAELLAGLQSAGFEIAPRTALAASSAAKAPDLVLAEIHELDIDDRRAIESLRQARPQFLAIGIGTPVVVALARGRRRARNYAERRSGLVNRYVFDEFLSTPIDMQVLLELVQSREKRERRTTRKKSDR